ncbi:MAG: uracil-DNA glycosylase [Myxococcota bacterium]|nr:uracil-DNA glycosylase [Myxococcota bacterium]
MTGEPEILNTVSELATAVTARIHWELENGVPGYQPHETKLDASSTPERVDDIHCKTPNLSHPETLDDLRRHIGDCTRCDLHRGRQSIVFGEGIPNARLVFVGEGPGRDEDRLGRPFVGAAGQLLDRIIAAIGFDRSQVYICNVVKCRPPDNRVPTETEQATCGPFLRRQLQIIEPEIVVALGSTAAHFLLQTREAMGRLRGRFHDLEQWRVMPTYHPAYLLRNPSAKRPVWQDMQLVMGAMGTPNRQE